MCMHIGLLAEYSAEKENCKDIIMDTIFDENIITTIQPECTTTVIPTTTTIVSPSKCSRTEKTTIQRTKIVTTCPQMSISLSFVNNTKGKLAAVNGIPTVNMALGALLGLAVVLLAVVITGWVCACLIAKKRNR